MPKPTTKPAPSNLAPSGPAPAEAAEAFARLRAEFDALSPSELGRITLNVPAAVAVALGALPNLERLRPAMEAKLPSHHAKGVARLRDYALAALYAHLRALRRPAPEASPQALATEAAPLRERLLVAAEALAHFGLVDGAHVAAIRSGVGHLDTANDLIELAALFQGRWPELSTKTPLSQADVDRASELGPALVAALGMRQVGTDGAGAASAQEDARLRAFWAFYRAYEESRRAVAYLRWYEGDADELVPSLFTARRRGRAPADEAGDDDLPAPEGPRAPTEPAPAPTPPAPPASPALPALPTQPAPPAPATPATPAPNAALATPAALATSTSPGTPALLMPGAPPTPPRHPF